MLPHDTLTALALPLGVMNVFPCTAVATEEAFSGRAVLSHGPKL
eukprot:COSAG06_NODE_3161_length_5755_cov_3.280941_3_plen_44_part_00